MIRPLSLSLIFTAVALGFLTACTTTDEQSESPLSVHQAKQSTDSTYFDQDQARMTEARELFQNKRYEEAIVVYNRVTPKSSRWLLAVEEKAWAYVQLKQFDKAIALAHTLTNPALNPMTTIEPFLLRSIVELKLCDYSAVYRTLKAFRAQKRTQVEAIQKLVKTGRNDISRAALTKWMENPIKWQSIGSQLDQLPQLFFHDGKMLDAAAKKDMPAMEKRLQELAKIDQNENYRILQKLNLVEIESIQRAHIDSQFADKQGEVTEKRSTDEMVFKHSDKDQWLDEVNSYEATVNRCQKKSGRTM